MVFKQNKTKNIFDPPLRRVRPKVNTPLYLKSWTLLEFHTWRVYTPPKWREQALANIFSTILEARVRNQLGVVYISFSASNKKHEFYITGCHKDSSFQQRKLESFNMYIYFESYKADKSFMKHPAHNYNLLILCLIIMLDQIRGGGSCNNN